ncbi:hypothetical protein Taro_002414 [Colocasia esculenta]|uniref:Uncharacterized protein n=1 Tax=Colocasia esculenta TaxID=4460 RepID=A0A843TLH0_COLES|nr:hypothetical protein [Colocasia esculenta]
MPSRLRTLLSRGRLLPWPWPSPLTSPAVVAITVAAAVDIATTASLRPMTSAPLPLAAGMTDGLCITITYGELIYTSSIRPIIWYAPKKGHVYGFGHSLGTDRVISSCLSSISHVTSPFTTPTAPGGSSRAAPTMTPTQFREIVNETISQNILHIASQIVSQTLA